MFITAFTTARQMFITVFTTAWHLSLSWADESAHAFPSYFFKIHFIIISNVIRVFPYAFLIQFFHWNHV